jgi:hypothetical protein
MTTYTIIETPGGIGELRIAGAHLAKVFYRLQVRQAIGAGDAAAGQEAPAGSLEISGELSISQDEPMQSQVTRKMNAGELLTLHLADGRRIEVYTAQGDAMTGAYRVTPGGSRGFVAE